MRVQYTTACLVLSADLECVHCLCHERLLLRDNFVNVFGADSRLVLVHSLDAVESDDNSLHIATNTVGNDVHNRTDFLTRKSPPQYYSLRCPRCWSAVQTT